MKLISHLLHLRGESSSHLGGVSTSLTIPYRQNRPKVNPLLLNLEEIQLKTHPFVSIHIAVYNEKRVIERLIEACRNQQWQNYEVILVDDSTDETTEIIKNLLSSQGRKLTKITSPQDIEVYISNPPSPESTEPVIKLIHRASRAGFKGAALQKALENCNPHADYIAVFDSDFVPYPDTIEQFVKTFQVLNANNNANPSTSSGQVTRMDANISMDSQNLNSPTNSHSNIAAVQGYQWHVLNKSQNWVTRGVRTEYAGSYVIERAGIGIYGGLNMIAGSVYMIRADVLRRFGWGTSITEDFQLTLRLYEAGYKVAFTPYIQAPAECVATVRRLIRQRMRWAEGHTHTIKLMFARILNSKLVTAKEKLEFTYLAFYYLQAAFFLAGTFAWFLTEVVLKVRLPFWSAALGWSLVFVNFLSLPLMNLAGLFLEESEEKDYLGIASFILLSYILVPFQAYAAVKGLFEKEEGPWFRTPKTGIVTDVLTRERFFRLFRFFPLPARNQPAPATANQSLTLKPSPLTPNAYPLTPNPYTLSPILLPSSSHFLSGYKIRPKRIRWIARSALIFVLILAISVNYLAFFTPGAKASGTTPAIEQQINMIDTWQTTTSTSYTPTGGNLNSWGLVNWDSSKYDGTTSAYFEAVMKNTPTGGIGKYNSMALSGVNPVIAYYDVANADLKVAICNDPNCAGGNETVVTVDGCSGCSTNNGDVGQYNDIVIDTETGTIYHISYYDTTNTDLKYATCDSSVSGCDATGDWTVRCLVGSSVGCVSSTANNVGQYSQIIEMATSVYSNTYPAVSYYEATNADLFFAQCSNNTCSALTAAPICIDGDSSSPSCASANEIAAGSYASMVLEIGWDNVYISYYDATTTHGGTAGDPKLAKCTNNGTDWCTSLGEWTSNEIDDRSGANGNDETHNQGQFGSLTIDATINPMVSFQDTSVGKLVVAHCNDAACSGLDETINVVDADGTVGFYTSILFANGYPIISHIGQPRTNASLDYSLRISTCNDTDCAGSNETLNVIYSNATTGIAGSYTSLTLDNSNYPVVSFYSSTSPNAYLSDLMLLHCNDAACSGEDDPVNAPDPTSTISGATVYTYAGLFNDAGTQITCNSNPVEVSTSNREYTRVRFATNLNSTACSSFATDDDYTVQIKSTSASARALITSARLIITQTSTTMLTKTSTQVEVGALQSSFANTTYQDFLLGSPYYCYDVTQTGETCSTGASPSRFSPSPTVEFHATVKIASITSGDSVQAELYDGSSQVAQVSYGASTNWTRAEATGITLTAGKQYRVRVKCTKGGATECSGSIANAKVVLDQSDATNGVTALETVQTYNSTNIYPLYNNTYFIYGFDNSFVPANFTGSEAYYFESTMKVSNALGTATAQLYNKSDSSAIASSEITHTGNTTLTRVRSSSLDLSSITAAREFMVRQKCGTGCTNTAGYTHSNYVDWLIIQISSLPVPEYVIFALPAIVFLPRVVSWLKRRYGRKKLALIEVLGTRC